MIGFSAGVAFTLLSIALVKSGGHYSFPSICLVVVSLGVCLAGVCRRWSSEHEAWAARALPWLFTLLAAASLIGLLTRRPSIPPMSFAVLVPFRAVVVCMLVLIASYALPAVRAPWLLRARLPLVIAIYLAMGAWMIRASPEPDIDVWHFQQRAAHLLLDGQNPWAADYPNIYSHTDFVAETLLADGRIRSFPYPPLSLLLSTLGTLAGDVRWSLLVAVAAAVSLTIAAARRLGLPAGHVGELGALALLLHPRGFLLIDRSWTEPFVALAAAACVWAMTMPARSAISMAMAALLSVKQYGFMFLPALLSQGGVRPRAVVSATGLSALFVLPFVFWDAEALWRGLVTYQWVQPFRADALSIPALWSRAFGHVPSQLWGVVAGVVVMGLCALRRPNGATGSPARAALAGAAAYLAFFAFSKQAFFNYYWLVCALLSIAMAVPDREPAEVRCSPRSGKT